MGFQEQRNILYHAVNFSNNGQEASPKSLNMA